MRNNNFARRQFRLHLICTICWSFCSIARLIEMLCSAESQRPTDWFFLAVGIANAILNAYMCLERGKEIQKEEE